MNKGSHSSNTAEDSDAFESQIPQQSTGTKKPDTARGTSTFQMNINKGNKMSGNARITQKGPKFIKTLQPIDFKANINEDNIMKGKAAINQEAPSICAPASSKFEAHINIGNEMEDEAEISQAGGDIQEPTQTIHVKQMHFTDDIDFDPSKCKVRKLTEEEVVERLSLGVEKIFKITPYGKSRALIINNFEFSKKFRKRNAAEKDSTYLKNLLPQLGFKDPQVEHNKKRKEIEDIIANFTKNSMENMNAPMLLVFIGSHGKRVKEVDHFMDADCDLVPAKVIVEAFHASKCPHLKDKPKLFLFQFCREDSPASDSVEDDSSETMEFNAKEEASYLEWFKDDLATDAMKEDEKKDKANMLLSYSTAPGCLSYRHKEKGTFYVSALCKVFAENAYNDEIRVMLDKLNQAVSDGLGKKYVQLAVYDGEHLERDLFFLPHSSNEK